MGFDGPPCWGDGRRRLTRRRSIENETSAIGPTSRSFSALTPVPLFLNPVIGILLGLLGGGSILAVPALVYGAGLTLAAAVPTSLLVVGVSSATAPLPRLRSGLVQWRIPVAALLTKLFRKPYRSVGPQQAAALIADGAVLLDVREPAEWRAGHAPRARPGLRLHSPRAAVAADRRGQATGQCAGPGDRGDCRGPAAVR